MSNTNIESVLGNHVWKWPEFLAFATRLGIDTTLPMTSLQIDIPCDREVVVTQEFYGRDMNDERDTDS